MNFFDRFQIVQTSALANLTAGYNDPQHGDYLRVENFNSQGYDDAWYYINGQETT